MKTTNFLLLLFTIALYACEGETIRTDKGGQKSIHLRGQIKEASPTRATNSSWENNDAIGVFMVQSGKSIEEGVIQHNVKYVTTGSSTFNPANNEEEVTFPFDQSKVDFISYYPYKEEINGDTYPISLENQSIQSNIDLLYSNNAKDHDSENTDVDMQFVHQLSKIILKISTDKNVNLSKLSIILSDAGIRANFNLSTGEPSLATERGDILFNVSTDGLSAEAILLPETITPDMILWFIVENDYADQIFQIPLSEALGVESLTKCTLYTCNANLSYETVSISTENNITTWTEKTPVSKTVNRTADSPPVVKGSRNMPFSVAESIVNQGRTNVWVDGYIVGSFDKSENIFKPGVDGAATNNVMLADTPHETDITKMIPVLIPGMGPVREKLIIPDNPENIGKRVLMRGRLSSFFSVPALLDVNDLRYP